MQGASKLFYIFSTTQDHFCTFLYTVYPLLKVWFGDFSTRACRRHSNRLNVGTILSSNTGPVSDTGSFSTMQYHEGKHAYGHTYRSRDLQIVPGNTCEEPSSIDCIEMSEALSYLSLKGCSWLNWEYNLLKFNSFPMRFWRKCLSICWILWSGSSSYAVSLNVIRPPQWPPPQSLSPPCQSCSAYASS
jgi:hypothetical protein